MRRRREKQDRTKQLAATSVERVNRKPGKESSGVTAGGQMEKKKAHIASTPVASTWNIAVDTDGLKPEDDTATV